MKIYAALRNTHHGKSNINNTRLQLNKRRTNRSCIRIDWRMVVMCTLQLVQLVWWYPLLRRPRLVGSFMLSSSSTWSLLHVQHGDHHHHHHRCNMRRSGHSKGRTSITASTSTMILKNYNVVTQQGHRCRDSTAIASSSGRSHCHSRCHPLPYVFCRYTCLYGSHYWYAHHRNRGSNRMYHPHNHHHQVARRRNSINLFHSTITNGNNNTNDGTSTDDNQTSNTMNEKKQHQEPKRKRIRIVGGGLAGLSVAYHLLLSTVVNTNNEQPQEVICDISIFDRQDQIGTGGASAIAGGLLHPLSPRGKLVHWGLEGLAATNRMIDAAINSTASLTVNSTEESSIDTTTNHNDASSSHNTIRLRDELFRIAISEAQAKQLQDTASMYPDIAEWRNDIDDDDNSDVFRDGRLRLYNGCCVLHVPSYLRGVYKACQLLALNGKSTIRWCPINTSSSQSLLMNSSDDPNDHFDVTIYCYGSNMFQRRDDDNQLVDFTALSLPSSLQGRSTVQFPVQLVRGQSMEVLLARPLDQATLCGKYITPLPPPPPQQQQPNNSSYNNRVLIGATHEFSSLPLTPEQVITELQLRTSDFAPFQFNDCSETNHSVEKNTISSSSNYVISVDRITCGYRVQSTRGKYGRRPIIGQLSTSSENSTTCSNWIFSGLSSRGLLYHALYGQFLAEAIIQDDESVLLHHCPDILWWKTK